MSNTAEQLDAPELRSKRVSDFWNWLPAFRAVAEEQHLPSAAARLGVSSSALSRTVRLLEEEMEAKLFIRVGRRIVLNEKGRVLLAAVRDAMRRVDDGYQLLQPTALAGRVLLSGRSTHVWLLAPAMSRMRREHAGLVPSLRSLADELVPDALREGSLDVALVDRPSGEPDIEIEKLACVAYGIYCGVGHPLHGRDEVDAEEVLRHPFVTPPVGVDDNWPADVRRIVGAEVDLFTTGVALAECGTFLALLPEPAAAQRVAAGALSRVPYAPAPALPLYAAYRRAVGEHPLTAYVLEVLRANAAGDA